MSEPTSTSFDDWTMDKVSTIDWASTKVKQNLALMVDKLDEYQRKIVLEHNLNRNSKVTANAGSGKTLVLIVRALKMVIEDGVPAEKIVLITFTNKATDEIRARYEDFFRQAAGEDKLREIALPHISTIHSFGKNIVNYVLELPFSVMTKYDSYKILGDIIVDITKMTWAKSTMTDQIMETIRNIYSNNELHLFCLPQINQYGRLIKVHTELNEQVAESVRTMNQFSASRINDKIYGRQTDWAQYISTRIAYYVKSSGVGESQFRQIITKYITLKYERNKMDFADMVSLPMLYMTQHPSTMQKIWNRYEQFILDESQDMDLSQVALAILCDQHSYELFMNKPKDNLGTRFNNI